MQLKLGKKYKDRNDDIWEVVCIVTDIEIRYPIVAVCYPRFVGDDIRADTFTLEGVYSYEDEYRNLIEEVK